MNINWNKYLHHEVIKPIFQAIDYKGTIINKDHIPPMTNDEILHAYELMCFIRNYQKMTTQAYNDGKIFNFMISTGQEAIQTAMGLILKPKVDWFVAGFRSSGTWITLGKPLYKILQYWLGYEDGNTAARNLNIIPLNVLIATQCSHAVGIALANKVQNKPGIVMAAIGDGGLSEGEFYSAMNMAAVMKLKVIFMVQNNQWAHSTPPSKETACQTLAQKGISVGINGIQVDGNDFFASYHVLQYVHDYVDTHSEPFIVEALTYRMCGHDAKDVPTIYRDEAQHQKMLQTDPLIRFKKYLINHNLWSEAQQEKLDLKNKKGYEDAFEIAWQTPKPQLKDLFVHTYETLPPHLITQYQKWAQRHEEAQNE